MKNPAPFLFALLLIVPLLTASLAAAAADVGGVYRASVTVTDRTDAERKRAISEGFSQVLVRVSGDSAIGQQDAVIAAAASAERYVVQYGYETRALTGENAGQKATFLNVQYDASGISNFLRRAGLPIWTSNRVPLLLWLAWEQGLDRDIVNDSTHTGAYQTLQEEAVRRGVTLVFPAYDSEDRSRMSIADIWGVFPQPVLMASQRYEVQTVLMAKVRETDGVQISAMLYLDGQQYAFEVRQADSSSALRQLLDQVVDRVASHFALVVSGQDSQQVVLAVDGVQGLNDFAALTRYLDTVLPISLYRMRLVQDDQVEFVLSLEGGMDALLQSFRLDRKLEPVTDMLPALDANVPMPGADGDVEAAVVTPTSAVIRYRWRG